MRPPFVAGGAIPPAQRQRRLGCLRTASRTFGPALPGTRPSGPCSGCASGVVRPGWPCSPGSSNRRSVAWEALISRATSKLRFGPQSRSPSTRCVDPTGHGRAAERRLDSSAAGSAWTGAPTRWTPATGYFHETAPYRLLDGPNRLSAGWRRIGGGGRCPDSRRGKRPCHSDRRHLGAGGAQGDLRGFSTRRSMRASCETSRRRWCSRTRPTTSGSRAMSRGLAQ